MRIFSAQHVLAAPCRAGFDEVTRRGSHVKLRNATGRTVIVPAHREIAHGTMRSILRQAGLTEAQFEESVR